MDEEKVAALPEEPEQPREVILRYMPPEPKPVVERYIHRDPLPGRRRHPPRERRAEPPPEEPEDDLPVPEERQPGNGRRIAAGVLAALLILSAAGVGLHAYRERERQRETAQMMPYQFEWNNGAAARAADTEIPRYPTGGAVRLGYTEHHGETMSVQDVYLRVNPCTVTVAASAAGGGYIIGAGVIFTEDGYILTNAHVIAGGRECFVVRDVGRSYNAKLVGFDEEKDLAVLKIEASGLPTAEFGDSDALNVGDTVYAIGNPLGVELRGTLTDGIVSAINRDVMVDGVSMTLIQTNAALNNGNSGGPLINVYGQVVGINTMKMGSSSTVSVEGLGFAIPISSAAWMVNDLIEFGEIHAEPVLGVSVVREPVVLPTGETALEILEIVPGGSGDAAGLELGDRIVRADGEVLEGVNDLLRARRRYGRGESITLEIDRNGQRLLVDVVLT